MFLSDADESRLRDFLLALVNQEAARVLIEPYERACGFWFGGGNVLQEADGTILITGRYRNHGDSRTGVAAGARGLELAIFASGDGGLTFTKERSWSKADLSYEGNRVVSIEGSALHPCPEGGYELFVSSEKDHPYPEEVAEFQKPGTGVWSIDIVRSAGFQPAEDIGSLDAAGIGPALADAPAPGYLHVKDPMVFDAANGDTVMVFCDHPFLWCSVNSGYAVRPKGESEFSVRSWETVPRGPAWDVAGTRITNRMPVPRVGAFANLPALSVYFYDGLECYRKLEEGPQGVQRPRGYSCEELGGALYGFDDEFPRMTRLSRLLPLFVSPNGTGCSRYVDTLVDEAGVLAIWQQSQADESQPLVGHFLALDEVVRILA